MKITILLCLVFSLSSCMSIQVNQNDNNENEINDIKVTLEEQQEMLQNQSEKIDNLEQKVSENNNTQIEDVTNEKTLTNDEITKDIKEKFHEINFWSAYYMKLSATLYWEASWGNEITGFYNQDKWWHLDKIVEKYYGDMWKWIIEYYFWDNQLFFVFTQDTYYDKPITFDDFKEVSQEQNRYYFYEWQLIEWIKPGAILADEDEAFQEKNVEYFVQAGEYREFLLEHGIWVD